MFEPLSRITTFQSDPSPTVTTSSEPMAYSDNKIMRSVQKKVERKVNKETCLKRIKKRFGATNRCSYIIIGGREDVELAKRQDLPCWPLSRSDGHRQLLQLYTALNDGFLI